MGNLNDLESQLIWKFSTDLEKSQLNGKFSTEWENLNDLESQLIWEILNNLESQLIWKNS